MHNRSFHQHPKPNIYIYISQRTSIANRPRLTPLVEDTMEREERKEKKNRKKEEKEGSCTNLKRIDIPQNRQATKKGRRGCPRPLSKLSIADE